VPAAAHGAGLPQPWNSHGATAVKILDQSNDEPNGFLPHKNLPFYSTRVLDQWLVHVDKIPSYL
jgi:hypothetical protein